jgi:hypothetical protein
MSRRASAGATRFETLGHVNINQDVGHSKMYPQLVCLYDNIAATGWAIDRMCTKIYSGCCH